jgi:hypothetical protein
MAAYTTETLRKLKAIWISGYACVVLPVKSR